MDKVYINKSEIENMFQNNRKKAGPILTALILVWMILSALLFGIPTLIFLLITVLIYLPFYPLDKILGRKNNGNNKQSMG